MKASHQLVLLKESLEQLRQVRSALLNESNHGLGLKIDEAIRQLEEIEHAGTADTEMIQCVLKVLGQGFAAIPYIVKLIESFSGR